MRRRVLIIVETSYAYGRAVLRGINRYVVAHQAWSITLDLRGLMAEPPTWLADWDGDGVISRSTDPAMADLLRRRNIPAIDLTDIRGDLGLPRIWTDHAAVGAMAAGHLLERGFTQFGFCGFAGHDWSARRRDGFAAALPTPPQVFEMPWDPRIARPSGEEQRHLADWLHGLTRPVGVMACNDVQGRLVLEAARQLDLSVPEEVAVVGVDNDDLLCPLCDPPLSSVVPSAERIGYAAAEALDTLMHGETLDWTQQEVPPVGVITRQSSDVLAIDDRLIAAAVRLIRQRACSGLNVSDVLREVPLSRSVLERRFRKYFGHSPQAEIRNVQVKRVKQLLAESDLTLERIAGLTGFEHPEYLSVLFRREEGETPGAFRARHRAGSPSPLPRRATPAGRIK